MQNIDLLQDALTLLYTEDVKAEYIDHVRERVELMRNRIKQFITLNTPKTKSRSKFNIYKWVSTEYCRPNLMGVYHDAERKVAVATDCVALVASAEDYNDEHAGKIIAKNGDEIRGKYVSWDKVIPRETPDILPVDRERVAGLLTTIKAERKADKRKSFIAVNIGSADHLFYVDPKYAALLLTLPDGVFKYVKDEPHRPMLFISNDETTKALFMPKYIERDRGQDLIVDD